APSLAARRFSGSECFFFFFDEPHKSLNLDDWSKILVALSDRRKSGLQVLAFKTNYATCKPGERVQIRIQVTNHRPKASSMSLRISAKAPDKNEYTRVTELRRVAEGGCSTEALCDYLPEKKIGLWQ